VLDACQRDFAAAVCGEQVLLQAGTKGLILPAAELPEMIIEQSHAIPFAFHLGRTGGRRRRLGRRFRRSKDVV
jgi:hypothetical protein